MEYFVTGATGLVGTHVVEELTAGGHDVVALTRSRPNAAHLPDEVRVVEGDVTEKGSVREAMRGVDGVFHVAAWFYVGPGPRNVETAERTNVGGTRNVLELMDELDVPRGVYTSTVGVFPGTSENRVVESTTPEKPTFAVYFRTKWEAHYEVARPMMEDGLPLVVVMPGAVFGPGDKLYGTARAAFRDYLTGDLPVVPRRFTIPFDYVEDTARAHLLAMDEGTPGEEYVVAGEPRTLPEVFDCAERITGIAGPRAVPDRVFGTLASAMRVAERVVTPPEGYETEMLEFFAGKQYNVDNTKAKRELGLEHRPLEEGLREYLTWEREQLGAESERKRAQEAVQ